jgi:hypothetical protein
MAMILVRVFVDAACMMSPYGTAWRRQKEEAGAESGFHFQAVQDGMGRRLLVAILLSLRKSLDRGDGYGWVLAGQ